MTQAPTTSAATQFAHRALLTAVLALGVLLPTGVAHAAFADPNPPQDDDILAGVDKFAAGAKESNEVTLDKNMLGMAGNFMGPDTKDLAGNMDSVLIREYDYPSPGMYKMADVEAVRKRLDGAGWKHLVRTKETTEKGTEMTDICVRADSEGTMHEMVIISAEPKELSFIHLRGRLTAKQLSQLGGSLGAPTGDLQLKPRPPQ